MAKAGAYVVPALVTYDAISRFGKRLGAAQTTLDKLQDVHSKGLEAIDRSRSLAA